MPISDHVSDVVQTYLTLGDLDKAQDFIKRNADALFTDDALILLNVSIDHFEELGTQQGQLLKRRAKFCKALLIDIQKHGYDIAFERARQKPMHRLMLEEEK